jgi:hypothetical protein
MSKQCAVNCQGIAFVAKPTAGAGERNDHVVRTVDVNEAVGVDDIKVGLVAKEFVVLVILCNQKSN